MVFGSWPASIKSLQGTWFSFFYANVVIFLLLSYAWMLLACKPSGISNFYPYYIRDGTAM